MVCDIILMEIIFFLTFFELNDQRLKSWVWNLDWTLRTKLFSQSVCTALTAGICLPLVLCRGTVSDLWKTVETPTGHWGNPNLYLDQSITKGWQLEDMYINIMTVFMMTSSNGNIFRVTGHVCGEFTGPRWIPRTMASDAEFWCFLWSAPE